MPVKKRDLLEEDKLLKALLRALAFGPELAARLVGAIATFLFGP